MAFAGIFQPFARLRWIRFGLLMRDRKFSRRFSVPQTTALAPFPSPTGRLLPSRVRPFGDNGAKRGQQHPQKSGMVLHFLCFYGHPTLSTWFTSEYKKNGKKLDMGKGCVRFKSLDDLAWRLPSA